MISSVQIKLSNVLSINTFLTDRIFHPTKYNYCFGGQIHILRGHRSQTIYKLQIYIYISMAGVCFYSANSVVPDDLFSSNNSANNFFLGGGGCNKF